VNLAQGQKHLPSNEPTDDARNAESDSSLEGSHTIMTTLTVLLVLTIFVIVLCCALLAIAKRQGSISELLLRQSGGMQEILAQGLHDSRSREGSDPSGKRN
jgi:hypothetical protein